MAERTKRPATNKRLPKSAPTPTPSAVDMLANAVLSDEPIEHTLAQLGLTHHTYHEFLLTQVDYDPEHFFSSVRAILREMRVAETVLFDIELLKLEGDAVLPTLRKRLTRLRLPHLDAYLAWPIGAPLRYRILGRDMFDGTPYVGNSYWSREEALAAARRQLQSNRTRVSPSSGDTSSIEDCVMVEDTATGETIWDSRRDARRPEKAEPVRPQRARRGRASRKAK